MQITLSDGKKALAAGCEAARRENVKSLDITNLTEGAEIQVEKSNDGVNWKPFPNDDGTAFVIAADGTYGLVVGNYLIRLVVDDEADMPADFLATLS